MNPNNESNFLDRGTILAIALAMLVFWGWSHYMNTKYPPAPATAASSDSDAKKEKVAEGAQNVVPQNQVNEKEASEPASQVTEEVVPEAQAESFITYRTENFRFDISSNGMGLRNIQVGQYETRENTPIVIGAVENNFPFTTSLVGTNRALEFAIEQTGPNFFVGRATIDGMAIEKTLDIDPTTYSIKTNVKVTGAGANFSGLVTTVSDVLHENKGGSFLVPTYDFQDWYVAHEGTKTRQILSKADGNEVAASNVTVISLSAHYFTLAVVDRSDILPKFEAKNAPNAATAVGRLIYQPINKTDTFAIRYVAYAGPKSMTVLSQVNERLTNVIDFGMFAFLAKPMLNLMRYLHSIVGNWGWAIVLLTIIVRLIVLPFNMYSMKSMKAMQKIQPEMNRIREKYKDKPADQKMQMNQEIMQLMKQSKANPLGGCLPMLLQLPVFFALYQVLAQSIELYRAPFIFWIHDLSVMDPYFVLPILMAITMFVQQKITPTTMDPQQAKIMLWMPVIFAFFMISLPSGLTLYIFVSTLFGIIQQYILMRDSAPVQTVKEAKA